MGREVRKVPKDWEHPKEVTFDWRVGNLVEKYRPLSNNYSIDFADFEKDVREMGLKEAVEYWGGGPSEDDYMPEWADDEATHFMMYEDTSEGTPISPAFATIEELARWLADNGASAFGRNTATYEQWLSTCQQGYAISAVGVPGKGIISGVEAQHILDNDEAQKID